MINMIVLHMDIGSLYIDHYLKRCQLNTERKLLSEDSEQNVAATMTLTTYGCVVIVQTDHGVSPESIHGAHSASCSQ